MKDIIFIELDTRKEIGNIDDIRNYLKLDDVRLKHFEESLSYYKEHAWYGGFNSDLSMINLQAK